jgi:hypothetical protein
LPEGVDCGEDVKKGLTACGECGFDFAAALAPTSSASNA